MTRRPFLLSTAVVLALGLAGEVRAADTPIDTNQLATELNKAIAAAPANRAIRVDPLDAGAAPANGAAPAQAGVDPLAGGQLAPNGGPVGGPGGNGPAFAGQPPQGNGAPGNPPQLGGNVGNGVANPPPPLQGLAQPGANQQGGNPGVVAGPPTSQVAGGGDLYNRIAQQGYRPIHLVDSNAAVFVVLAADQYRPELFYLLTVDIAYGQVKSVRPIDVASLGNYGVAPPPSPYGNPYQAPGYGVPQPGYYGTPPQGYYGTPAPGYAAPQPGYGGQRY